jgi:hypothetical protein
VPAPHHPLVRRGGHTRLWERGWGSPNSDKGTYTVALCIYKYFVIVGVSGQRVVEEGEVGAVDPGEGGGGAKKTRGKWKVC